MDFLLRNYRRVILGVYILVMVVSYYNDVIGWALTIFWGCVFLYLSYFAVTAKWSIKYSKGERPAITITATLRDKTKK